LISLKEFEKFKIPGIDVKKLRKWHQEGVTLHDHYIEFKKILMEEIKK